MERGPLTALVGLLTIALAAFGEEAPDAARPCFDFTTTVVEPLHPPIPMVPGRDNSVFGTYPNGVNWAATRARMAMPITELYAKLRDHRNHKDMKKTTLATTELERPGYLDFQRVDVAVTLRALFIKVKVGLDRGVGLRPRRGHAGEPAQDRGVLPERSTGHGHLKHMCGSYVLQAVDDATSDLSLYDEVIARRRGAEDTRDMQAGILGHIRGPQP